MKMTIIVIKYGFPRQDSQNKIDMPSADQLLWIPTSAKRARGL
jgi:hypothetical protein